MSRQSILDTAAAQNGVKESPAGSNKTPFGVWYGLNGVKWCAIFVSWVYDHAGHPLEQIDTAHGYQACQSGYNYWKRKNRITKDPQPGDIVLYDWEGDGHSDHTGIFVKWLDAAKTSFRAWEGNTEQGNDSDGGKVMLRDRKRTLVKAFVTPEALAGAASVTDNDETLAKGDRGSAVTIMQKMLHDLKYDVTVDGFFGPQTQATVKQFQKDHSLPETGIVTPEVLGVMQEEVSQPPVADKKMSTGSYIRKGDAGAPVVMIQEALNAKGAKPKLIADGVFGPGTQKAVKAFQLKNKLEADGVVGPKTFAKLGITGI